MPARNLRIIFITGSILLAVGLYFAPSQINNSPSAKPGMAMQNMGLPMEGIQQSARTALDDEKKGYISALEARLSNDSNNLALYDSLGKAWEDAGIAVMAAWYYERKALKQPNEGNYINAAYRYFDAFKIANDSILKKQLVEQAIRSYQKVLEFNPENLNAKTDLGVCYAEGTSEPMKGILLLREVVTKNPNHEMAQFNLAMLSLKSNQLDKAIYRLKKVIEINPGRKEIMYYIGRTYIDAGKNDSALYWLQQFKKESDDLPLVQQADELIKQLKPI